MASSAADSTPTPSFDVVIPCYNSDAYLAEALDSVAAQIYPARRLIVVDDVSMDDSVAIARGHGAEVLSTGTNSGPARARNLGAQASTADYVAFLDADDTWDRDHLAELASLVTACPSASVFYSRVRMTDGIVSQAPLADPAFTLLNLRRRLFQVNPVPQSAVAVKRRALNDAGGYDESLRFSEDYDLWLRMSRSSTFACSHKITVNYRVHETQATKNFEKLLRAGWQVRMREVEWAEAQSHERNGDDVSKLLLGAWRADLEGAWNRRNRAHLDVVLGLEALVPESAALGRTWRRRRRLWWILASIQRTIDLLPEGPKRWLRSIRRRIAPQADYVAPAETPDRI